MMGGLVRPAGSIAPCEPTANACLPAHKPHSSRRDINNATPNTHLAARDAQGPEVPQDEVVVGAASHQVVPVLHQARCQGAAVGDDLGWGVGCGEGEGGGWRGVQVVGAWWMCVGGGRYPSNALRGCILKLEGGASEMRGGGLGGKRAGEGTETAAKQHVEHMATETPSPPARPSPASIPES